MEVVNNIVSTIQGIDPSIWALAGSLLAASGLQQLIKRKVQGDTRKLSDGSNVAISAALSGLVVAGDTFFGAAQANPQLLGVKEAAALGGMTTLYYLVVKPVDKYVSALMADARAFREHQTILDPAAVVPVDAATENTITPETSQLG